MALEAFPKVRKTSSYTNLRHLPVITVSIILLALVVSSSLNVWNGIWSCLHSIPNDVIYIGGSIDIPLIVGISAAAILVLAALLYFFIKMKKDTGNLEKVRAEAVELDRREMSHVEIEAQAVELTTREANENNHIIILPPSCIILNV